MPAFRYKHGDRPLDGYTIQRGAGRGGFGEVYYAIADSGREVALKIIQGFEQVELRGVSQCMNLKSPHLVTIFDVRRNDEGTPFVIMEYVNGPSLRELLDQNPGGLGTQKAAFFLREMGKGLQYLHDCGIVHRDLKPANVFYENGYVKIGDYGLSKSMSASVHSGQTITVGTVHYMAPEIGQGKYDRSIDIYALGAVLFELLTGQVPYLGGSAGEILMKHMTAEVNVSAIEEPFATVIKKAMAKDPAHRYASVQEMVEAVFGSEEVRNSVSAFSPGDLSMVARRAAQRVTVGVGGSSAMPPSDQPGPDGPPSDMWQNVGAWADRVSQRVIGYGEQMPDELPQVPAVHRPGMLRDEMGDPTRDPMPARHRRLLVGIILAVIGVATALISEHPHGVGIPAGLFVVLAALGITVGIHLARTRILPRMTHDRGFAPRLVLAACATALCLAFSAIAIAMVDGRGLEEEFASGWIGVAFALFVLDWKRLTAPGRPVRVAFAHTILAAVIGLVLTMFIGNDAYPHLPFAILAAASLSTQIASPWDPFNHKRFAAPSRPNGNAHAPAAPNAQDPRAPLASANPPRAVPPPLPPQYPGVPVAQWVPTVWLFAMVLFLSFGLILLIYPGVANVHDEEIILSVGFGIGLLVLALISLCRARDKRFTGWWPYLVRPLLQWACLQSILLASLSLGISRLRDEEILLALFFIIFPGLMLIMLWAIRRQGMEPVIASHARQAFHAAVPPPPASPLAPPPADTPNHVAEIVPPPSPAYAFASPSMTTLPGHSPVLAAPRPPLRLGSMLAAFVGSVALLGAIVAGAALAIDLPQMLAAGIPDQRTPEQFTRDFGSPNWPRLMESAIAMVFGALLVIAAALHMLSRRWAGPAHMLRALVAIGLLLAAVLVFDRALSASWQDAALVATGPNGQFRPALAFEHYFDNAVPGHAILGAIATTLALVTLLWPASKQAREPHATKEVA